MLDFKVTTFDNGLKVVTAPLPKSRAVTVMFLFGVGSRFEEARLNGISHFLEHMYFKGTNKRQTALDISKDLDGVGAGYNAFTGEEVTGFFVRVSSEHFDLGLDVLQDMLFNSKFDAEEIEREKGVIIEEINMYNDDPRAKVENVAKELIFEGNPLGRGIAGERETVSKFTREDFLKYREEFYRPSNMVVIVAGGPSGLGPAETDGEASTWLKALEPLNDLKDEKTPSYQKVETSQTEPQVKIFNKKTDQAHFILAFRGIKRSDDRRPILNVMNNLMGQMMSSRLFIEVRERRGLCYYIHTDAAEYHDTGAWFIQAGVDLSRTEEAIEVILKEIEKLKSEPVTDEELTRAKENLKGRMFLSLEESMAVATLLGEQQLLLGKIKDPDELAAEIDAVTKDDIKALANEILVSKNLNLALVGPFEDESRFKKLIG